MLLKETTYTDFILYLVERDIDYVECKSYVIGSKDEIIEVVPCDKYRTRWFYVVSEKQIIN